MPTAALGQSMEADTPQNGETARKYCEHTINEAGLAMPRPITVRIQNW